MDELERRKTKNTMRLSAAPFDVRNVHPNVALDCSRNVASLEALRSLIGTVVLTQGEKRGELMDILDTAETDLEQRRTNLMPPALASPATNILIVV